MALDGSMLLGIDGGGTHCRARLADESGTTLGAGVAGAANLTLGVEVAAAAIRAAAEGAFRSAGLDASRVARVRAGFGLAGANVPGLADAIGRAAFGFASVTVASDAVAACLGAHGGGDGGALILGTGSQGLAIVNGRASRVGGWGFALSDDASGAALGRSATRAALAAHDGLAPRSSLTERIMDRFGRDPASAVAWAGTATPGDYGAFAPVVFELGDVGDAVATSILRRAAGQVGAMVRRLADLGAERIALMGGLARPYGPWLEPDLHRLLAEPAGDALDGAIRLARNGAPLFNRIAGTG